MNPQGSTKGELTIAGSGGQGVLTIGKMLARAATTHYENVVWFPLYGHRMRGGPSECVVIFSQDRIDSPILPKFQAVIVSDSAMLADLQSRVRPGGLMIVDSVVGDGMERQDIEVLSVPAMNFAKELGDIRVCTLFLLGAYTGRTQLIAAQSIESEIEKKFRGNNALMSLNLRAFKRGLEIGSG